MMAQNDRKDRFDISKGAADTLRQQWFKDSDLAHDSTMPYYKDHQCSIGPVLIGELNREIERAKRT